MGKGGQIHVPLRFTHQRAQERIAIRSTYTVPTFMITLD